MEAERQMTIKTKHMEGYARENDVNNGRTSDFNITALKDKYCTSHATVFLSKGPSTYYFFAWKVCR